MVNDRRVFKVGPYGVTVLRESITDLALPVDALVSSDDNHLTHGGGVSRAIWHMAGSELEAFVATHRVPLELGELFITPAGELKAQHIVHAITIDFDANRRAGARDVQDLYSATLSTAQERGWRSMALPLLAAGAGRVSPLEVVRSFCIALKEQPDNQPLDIFLCIVEPSEVFAEYLREIQVLLTPSPESGEEAQGVLLNSFAEWLKSSEWSQESGPDDGPLQTLRQFLDVSDVSLLEVTLNSALDHLLAEDGPAKDRLLLARTDLGEDAIGSDTQQRPPLTLGETWHLLQQADLDLPQDLRAAVGDAIRARNFLVHRGEDPRTRKDLAQGAAKLLAYAWKAGWIQHLDAFKQIQSRHWPKQSRALRVPIQPKNSIPPPPATTPAAHPVDQGPSIVKASPHYGTQAVLDLRRFLQEAMDPEDLQETLQDCRDRGYQGDDEAVLLEFCVQHKDLVELLSEHVPAPRLRKKLKERGLTPGSGVSGRDLAEQFLDFTGFPRQRPATGLNHLRESLRRALHEISDSGPDLIRAKVNSCACDLEWCLKLLVRFIVHWALKSRTMDQYLVEQGWMDQGSRVEGLTLGQLFALLGKMEKKVRSESEYRELCMDLGEDRILPSYTFRISELRNMFSHDKREDWEKVLPAREVYPRGKEFLEKTLELVDYLARAKHRVFPFVVRIESITIDNWGRRIIKGTSDGEPDKLLETLFTESELRPGEHYLMRPLSNPWRVEPVMVAIGDAADRTGGP